MGPTRSQPFKSEKLLNSKVFVVANGCHENRMDATSLINYLENEYHVQTVNSLHQADFIVVQGCSVTQYMENESRAIVDYVKKKKDRQSVLVTGCVSKLRPEFVAEKRNSCFPISEIDDDLYRMGNLSDKYAANGLYENPDQLKSFLKKNKEATIHNSFGFNSGNDIRKLMTHYLYNGLHFCKNEFEKRIDIGNSKTFCIKVSTGCTGKCSYCSIRLARGNVKSKSIEKIIMEFKEGLQLGYKHFGLIGTDLGDYGKDINSDLYELLSRILEYKGDYYIKLRNVSPRWLIPNHRKLKKLLKSRKIIYLQSPVQSGSDKILDLMNRGYRSGDYMAAVSDLKQACKNLFMRTQIIVGFPTETDACFNESKKLAKSRAFDYIDVFRFTKRKGTAAADIFPEVPDPIIVKRYGDLFLRTLYCRPVRKLKGVRSLYYYNAA